MDSVVYLGGMIALWAVNLLNGTGLGAAYRTTEYARILVCCLAALVLLESIRRQKGWLVRQRYFFAVLALLAVFIGVSLVKGQRFASLEYLWVYLIVYILSRTRPKLSTLRLVGFSYAVLGLLILLIYNYTDILKGWNANSIAMIGLFSYLIFIIPFYGARDFRSFFMLALVGGLYIWLIWPTGSRACAVAILIALLLSFRILSIEGILSSRGGLYAVLLVPLCVALVICALSGSGAIAQWDAWSMEHFHKPIFNGRDTAWLDGLRRLPQNFFFGTGRIYSGYWHNSAIACLFSYGAAGYLLWTGLFHLILCEGIPYIKDVSIIGSMTAFIVVYWQQSVELGIFAPDPDLLPYVMLGILLGRVNALRSELL